MCQLQAARLSRAASTALLLAFTVSCLALPAAAQPDPPITPALVRKVAQASLRSSANRYATSNGAAQARAAGVPIDEAYLAAHPGLAEQVPLTVPSEAPKELKYLSAGKLKPGSSGTALRNTLQQRLL